MEAYATVSGRKPAMKLKTKNLELPEPRLFANAQSARSWYRRPRESLNVGIWYIANTVERDESIGFRGAPLSMIL